MRRFRVLPGALLAAGGGMLAAAGGCTTQPIETSLRALEESGRISFVCIGGPEHGSILYPLSKCRSVVARSACDYLTDAGDDAGGGGAGGDAGAGGGGTGGDAGAGGGAGAVIGGDKPHLYGLVTQTFRGEVAVIDMTSQANDRLVDQDASVPGPSFLPVGGQPAGIVSTPGSTATFVTVAEVGREGIFAIPSNRLLRKRVDPANANRCVATWDDMPAPQRLSSWPACSLPAAPGEPVLVNDPPGEDGLERARCDAPYEEPVTGSPNGDLTLEGMGRPKLVVPLPALGGVAVIDAQELLDRPAGSFDPCPVDRWLLLDGEVPPVAPPEVPKGPACSSAATPEPAAVTGAPLPSGMAFAEGDLFVSDLMLPLIHRYAMQSPCEPVQLPPLLPLSLEEPDRPVTTSRLAVTPRPTAGLKRYLYANDVADGSIMVFDVSDGAATRTPLVTEHPEWTPLLPRDRVLRLAAAPRDIVIASRDVPLATPGTGVATEGIFCDPDPEITRCCNPKELTCCQPDEAVCNASLSTCDPATRYRTAADFGSGAGPYKLRGTFAFVLLTNGQIAIVDIEDLDGMCRGPLREDPLRGCETIPCDPAAGAPQTCPEHFRCQPGPGGAGFCLRDADSRLKTAGETSCNVVTPNTLRSSSYVLQSDVAGYNRPGLQSFPLLFDSTGAPLDPSEPTVPVMRATLPVEGYPFLSLPIGTKLIDVNATGGPSVASSADSGEVNGQGHLLLMNEETPRAQSVNQEWAVTYEGPLPSVGGAAAELRVKDGSGAPLVEPGLFDSSASYCARGVQSFEAVRARLTPPGPPPGPAQQAEIDKQARALADRVQLASILLDREDDYWDGATTQCTFDQCRETFGEGETLLPDRDFVIREAYEDRLLLEDVDKSAGAGPASLLGLAKCCFPTLVSYYVRPGSQWVVSGSRNGFLHHVIADPETGACRPSCDPALERLNGRVLRTPNSARGKAVLDGSATAFLNQMFRFAIVDGTEPPQRDMQFRFTTVGSFSPLAVTLLNNTRDIAPVGITFVPATNELAVTDGALQGVITVNLGTVQSSRQFF